ncbi:MAG: DNA cytosine methyltransferase [Gemmatimonadaceae bacterium]|nr:DNA cytosine methyltransferase [Gemmatimonadaceae bacterium]
MVDLFSGCGGLSLGLHQAGFRTILFSEINRDAADTFEENLGGVDVERVGGIEELSDARLTALKKGWKKRDIEVDIVAGGPPCQGFSGIGHRRSYSVQKEQIPSNHLFREMVRVVSSIRPKFFIFENVRGLLSGRWTQEGRKGEIWDEVRHTFERIPGYEVGWQLVQAKSFGIPQNRPRILLVGARKDLKLPIATSVRDNLTDNPRGLIPQRAIPAPDLVDVLDDLVDKDYLSQGKTERYLREPQTNYQRMMRTKPDGSLMRAGDELLEQDYAKHSARVVEKFQYMIDNRGAISDKHKTKKFAQRWLPPRWTSVGPTITATSLPDDFVHYSQPRILTVREWARLQAFPDWYKFRGPRTTGGHRRAGIPDLDMWEREVPRYTQIGNAVPVGLARELGLHLRALLEGHNPTAL